MARKKKVEGYHIIVEPRRLGNFGFASVSDRLVCDDEERRLRLYRERCEEILDQINRHVDNVGHTFICEESEDVCEHCGWTWGEPLDSPHNGGCCHEDCEVFYQYYDKTTGNPYPKSMKQALLECLK